MLEITDPCDAWHKQQGELGLACERVKQIYFLEDVIESLASSRLARWLQSREAAHVPEPTDVTPTFPAQHIDFMPPTPPRIVVDGFNRMPKRMH